MKRKLLWFGVILLSGVTANAQTIVDINPDKDNSIYEESENSSGIGRIFAGNNMDGDSRRALIHFDIAGEIPAGAIITSVELTLDCDQTVADEVTDYTLHKLTTDWGEGTSLPGGGGGAGAAAIAPDATWIDAMFGTVEWTAAGGDFIEAASASTELLGEAEYSWTSEDMVADVQGWLDDPASNFGWILLGDETLDGFAHRFGSKDLGTAPVLTIGYVPEDCEVEAVCNDLTVYLDAAGEATISPEDLDGGSVGCFGELFFDASQVEFTCEDIDAGEPISPHLVISGVFDGPLPGGLPKGVELYVVNDIEDLSIYGLGSANNGGGTDGEEFTFPAEPAEAGTYIYVASEEIEFNNFFGFAPDYVDGAANINGDDAIELFEEGEVVDIFGEIDVDGTDQPWEYLDSWAYRVSETGPDGTTFELGNWTFGGVDALDGELTNGDAETPVPVGTFTTSPVIAFLVTLTVTDELENIGECAAEITVLDTLAPDIICAGEFDLELDGAGEAILDVELLIDEIGDGCGVDEISLSMTEFSCENEGENEVWIYATDIYGNIDSCLTIVNIDASGIVVVEELEIAHVLCAGDETGAIDIIVEGGTPDYTYDWDNDGTGDDDDPEDLEEIAAGEYTVEVTDANGCQSTLTLTVAEGAEIEIDGVVMHESCPGASDGNIDLIAEGGEAPYTFSWTGPDGFVATTQDINEVPAGEYTVEVTDANGCTNSETFVIETTEFDLGISIDGTNLVSDQEDAEYQWVICPEYEEIEGATEQTLVPPHNGSFAVILTIGECVDTTECFPFEFEGINELNGVDVSIYPNPSTGLVNLQLTGLTEAAFVSVVDIKGSLVMNETAVNETTELNLNHVDNGVYFIRIRLNDAVVTQRISINR